MRSLLRLLPVGVVRVTRFRTVALLGLAPMVLTSCGGGASQETRKGS